MRASLRAYGLPFLLFAVSVVTTTANGARFEQNFLAGLPPVTQDSDLWPWPWLAAHPALLATGGSFSLALLGILLIHEFGHLLACRRHGIGATLPWVLPAPTLSGTLGAVIRLRSRIPGRTALMDVGIFGPLAGFVASSGAVAAGLLLGRNAAPLPPGSMAIFGGQPLMLRLIHRLLTVFFPSLPAFGQTALHPVLIAGWIGLFITALNLVPAGQLDGGHILYALSPRLHRLMTRLLPVVLIVAGVLCWMGWLVWGLLLLLPALRHERVAADTELPRSRWVLGLVALALLILSLTPTPFADGSLLQLFRL